MRRVFRFRFLFGKVRVFVYFGLSTVQVLEIGRFCPGGVAVVEFCRPFSCINTVGQLTKKCSCPRDTKRRRRTSAHDACGMTGCSTTQQWSRGEKSSKGKGGSRGRSAYLAMFPLPPRATAEEPSVIVQFEGKRDFIFWVGERGRGEVY